MTGERGLGGGGGIQNGVMWYLMDVNRSARMYGRQA